MKDGDRNTSYFHHKASQCKERNYIKGVFNGRGEWKEEEMDIVQTVTDFYGDLFTLVHLQGVQKALEGVESCVSMEHNEELCRASDEVEVREVLFQTYPHKALGPDGFHAMFYQHFWHIVGSDIVCFVNVFLRVEVDPRLCN